MTIVKYQITNQKEINCKTKTARIGAIDTKSDSKSAPEAKHSYALTAGVNMSAGTAPATTYKVTENKLNKTQTTGSRILVAKASIA